MNDAVKAALAQDDTIDITTTGRKSGKPRRLEIWFHRVGGRFYITGSPGARHWYANLQAYPEFVFHLKQTVQADLPARAVPIVERGERRRVLSDPCMAWYHQKAGSIDALVDDSPLVEVVFKAIPER